MTATKKIVDSGKDTDLKKAINSVLHDLNTTAEEILLSSILDSHYTMSLPNHSTRQFSPKKEFGWDTAVVDGFDQIVDM